MVYFFCCYQLSVNKDYQRSKEKRKGALLQAAKMRKRLDSIFGASDRPKMSPLLSRLKGIHQQLLMLQTAYRHQKILPSNMSPHESTRSKIVVFSSCSIWRDISQPAGGWPVRKKADWGWPGDADIQHQPGCCCCCPVYIGQLTCMLVEASSLKTFYWRISLFDVIWVFI